MTMKLLAVTVSALALQTAAFAAGAAPTITPAQQAAAGPFRFNQHLANTTTVIGLKGPALGYEDRVPEGRVLEAQYAILHALMGFQGHYSGSKAADEALLKAMDVQVAPLTGSARAILNARLGEVRHDRNFGIPTAKTKRTITLQQMADRHRALIAEHAGSVKALPKGALSAKADPAPGARPEEPSPSGAPAVTPREQYERVLALLSPIEALRKAATPAELSGAVARFNAAASEFGKGYALPAGEPGPTLSRALEIYKTERDAAAALGALQPDGAMVGLPDADALASKADLDARFDGAGRRPGFSADGLGGVRFTPSSRAGDGSELTQNAPAARADREPPAPGRDGDAGAGGAGLFGFLGTLLKAVVRTAARVVTAAISGAVGVAKALFS